MFALGKNRLAHYFNTCQRLQNHVSLFHHANRGVEKKIFTATFECFRALENKVLPVSRFNVLDVQVSDQTLEFKFSQASASDPEIKAVYFDAKQKAGLKLPKDEFAVLLLGGKIDTPRIERREDAIIAHLVSDVQGCFSINMDDLKGVIKNLETIEQAKFRLWSKPSLPPAIAFYKLHAATYYACAGSSEKKLAFPQTVELVAKIEMRDFMHFDFPSLTVEICRNQPKEFFHSPTYFYVSSQNLCKKS